MVRCSTFGLVLAWTAASVLAVGPEAFAWTAHSRTAVRESFHPDVGRDVHAVVALDGANAAAENRFAFTSALTGSALEHNVLIQSLFDEAVSAVRVLQTANFRGMKTFTVTPELRGTQYSIPP